MGPLAASGHWLRHMMSCHINLLELEAVFHALRQFHPSLEGKRVLLHKDNTTVSCYINKQGGARSRTLSHRTEELLLWWTSRSIQLSAQYVPGKLNILADLLSQPHTVLQSEWTLVHSVLKSVWSTWFTSQHRPLCHSVQSSPATVCVPSSRPSSLGSGCPVHSLVKSPVLCLPPDSHHREGSQKGKRRKGHPHSGGPSLASPGLVSRASPSVMFPPSGFCWALGLFFSPGQGFHTETQGCYTFTTGFCAGLAVFTGCIPLCAPLGGACLPSRQSGRVLRTLGQLGQMVWGSFCPAS